MSAPIEDLRKDIRMRDEADPKMSNAWLIIYLIPIFAIIIGLVSLLFSVMLLPTLGPEAALPALVGIFLVPLLALISFVVSIILTYKLVKRRNTHFKRKGFLFEDLISAVKSLATKKKVDVEVGLSSCERTVRETKAEETEKSAALWAILSAVVFLATWYVYYFLMKDFYKHERREDGFWEDIGKVLDKCDIKFSAPRRTEILPNRSFVLYLILNIITAGLFGIYWLYVLLKDPNEHFKYHIQVEDQLLGTLESVAI
ncbi:DUF4234 domain-containing protein [Candidatus Bathyarchaeota archaeon]|nr:DUF4234 domain-containing protein [Candidatus Bathyarchaeota archaeon]